MIRSVPALALLLACCMPALAEVPFAAVAGEARYSLAASSRIMMQGLDSASQTVMGGALAGADGAIPDALWSRVMAGALQTRRETAAGAETLWFNPLLDAGLAVRWTRAGDRWRVTAAAAVTGEQLRGKVPADAIEWPLKGGNLGSALRTSALVSFAAADASAWDRFFAAASESRVIVLRRAGIAQASLAALAVTPGYGDSESFLHQLLATGDPVRNRLPAALRRSLEEMGDHARLSLRPIIAFRLDDGWSVALQSPDTPGIVWLAHFADPAAGQPALPVAFNVIGLDPTSGGVAR